MELLGTLVEYLRTFIERLEGWVWSSGISIGEETIPFVVIALLGAGVYFTLRLGFVQLRRLGHGFAVATGRYDDPNEPGDVSHFQALSTALSATVGIGNIAGVAIALHWGGPGALFWMWVTAGLGMATKFAEVTLAQHFREVKALDPSHPWEGTVSGGPMYYIERGLGPRWKPMAILFAALLGITAFFTGNGAQANTVADVMRSEFGVPMWSTGLITAMIVGAVIIGGITRIGRVTAILAPAMAAIYVAGGLFILVRFYDQILPSLALVFREAFNPTAGVAGAGVGAFLVTMMWGVRRGLFSNEAGQGSAPIAHAAAKTDEPVSEGVVALLEPFIDTIVICTMTALAILVTSAWDDRFPTELTLGAGAMTYVEEEADGSNRFFVTAPTEIQVVNGAPVATGVGVARLAWNDVAIETFFVDAAQTQPFTGTIFPERRVAVAEGGVEYAALFGDAPQNGAPLTMVAFRRGLPGEWGQYIVVLTVLLFALSTAIAWSYYGDRCAYYLFGEKAVLPYKLVFVVMHFVGAIVPLYMAWVLGDIFLGIVILPNLLALVILTPKVKELSDSYFARRPWVENAEVHRRVVEGRRHDKR